MGTSRADRRVDPRIERSRQVILHAALQELGEVGHGTFTIESVAARAGVGKSTIYRHWPDKIALIADAFEASHQHAAPAINGLGARDALERLLRHVAQVLTDPVLGAPIPALIEGAERDQQLREFRHRYSELRRQSLTRLISQGVADGEFDAPTDPELAVQVLLGPIFYQRLLTSQPFDPARVGELITMALGSAPRQRSQQNEPAEAPAR
jgi:TetR/AcrR family transcriptional regulator, regulator of autoinduction and epiphytic fitness